MSEATQSSINMKRLLAICRFYFERDSALISRLAKFKVTSNMPVADKMEKVITFLDGTFSEFSDAFKLAIEYDKQHPEAKSGDAAAPAEEELCKICKESVRPLDRAKPLVCGGFVHPYCVLDYMRNGGPDLTTVSCPICQQESCLVETFVRVIDTYDAQQDFLMHRRKVPAKRQRDDDNKDELASVAWEDTSDRFDCVIPHKVPSGVMPAIWKYLHRSHCDSGGKSLPDIATLRTQLGVALLDTSDTEIAPQIEDSRKALDELHAEHMKKQTASSAKRRKTEKDGKEEATPGKGKGKGKSKSKGKKGKGANLSELSPLAFLQGSATLPAKSRLQDRFVSSDDVSLLQAPEAEKAPKEKKAKKDKKSKKESNDKKEEKDKDKDVDMEKGDEKPKKGKKEKKEKKEKPPKKEKEKKTSEADAAKIANLDSFIRAPPLVGDMPADIISDVKRAMAPGKLTAEQRIELFKKLNNYSRRRNFREHLYVRRGMGEIINHEIAIKTLSPRSFNEWLAKQYGQGCQTLFYHGEFAALCTDYPLMERADVTWQWVKNSCLDRKRLKTILEIFEKTDLTAFTKIWRAPLPALSSEPESPSASTAASKAVPAAAAAKGEEEKSEMDEQED